MHARARARTTPAHPSVTPLLYWTAESERDGTRQHEVRWSRELGRSHLPPELQVPAPSASACW